MKFKKAGVIKAKTMNREELFRQGGNTVELGEKKGAKGRRDGSRPNMRDGESFTICHCHLIITMILIGQGQSSADLE